MDKHGFPGRQGKTESFLHVVIKSFIEVDTPFWDLCEFKGTMGTPLPPPDAGALFYKGLWTIIVPEISHDPPGLWQDVPIHVPFVKSIDLYLGIDYNTKGKNWAALFSWCFCKATAYLLFVEAAILMVWISNQVKEAYLEMEPKGPQVWKITFSLFQIEKFSGSSR